MLEVAKGLPKGPARVGTVRRGAGRGCPESAELAAGGGGAHAPSRSPGVSFSRFRDAPGFSKRNEAAIVWVPVRSFLLTGSFENKHRADSGSRRHRQLSSNFPAAESPDHIY